MYDDREFNSICDSIVSNHSWFMERYRSTDRNEYMKRRLFVESTIYNEFKSDYHPLKSNIPVYFYYVPGMNDEIAKKNCIDRKNRNEINTKYVLLDLDDFTNRKNITCTLNDSFRSYRQKAIAVGIKCRPEENDGVVLVDHNKVFPIENIYSLIERYPNEQFEIQVWDNELISKVKERVLGNLA
jgi:hypothetical protein